MLKQKYGYDHIGHHPTLIKTHQRCDALLGTATALLKYNNKLFTVFQIYNKDMVEPKKLFSRFLFQKVYLLSGYL